MHDTLKKKVGIFTIISGVALAFLGILSIWGVYTGDVAFKLMFTLAIFTTLGLSILAVIQTIDGKNQKPPTQL